LAHNPLDIIVRKNTGQGRLLDHDRGRRAGRQGIATNPEVTDSSMACISRECGGFFAIPTSARKNLRNCPSRRSPEKPMGAVVKRRFAWHMNLARQERVG